MNRTSLQFPFPPNNIKKGSESGGRKNIGAAKGGNTKRAKKIQKTYSTT